MTSRFSAAARAAVLETLSPSSEAWRYDVRSSPLSIDRSRSIPQVAAQSPPLSSLPFDDNPGDDDTAVSESAYDGAIRRALNAVDDSNANVIRAKIDDYLSEVARQSSQYTSPERIAPAHTDTSGSYHGTAAAYGTPGSAVGHPSSTGSPSPRVGPSAARDHPAVSSSFTPSRLVGSAAPSLSPTAPTHATPSTPSTARALGRADAALAAAAVQSRLSSPARSVPSPMASPIRQQAGTAGVTVAATPQQAGSPYRSHVQQAMNSTPAFVSPSSDPHALVRAAEALYIAHADWRRTGAGQGREGAGRGEANPYLRADYAYERVGWPSSSSPSLISASLDRIHGGRAGSSLGGDRESTYPAHYLRHDAPASQSVMDTALAFCRELGVDATDPGSRAVLLDKCRQLRQCSILAASLDAFASAVCATLSTQAVGLVEVPLPSGAVAYQSARGYSAAHPPSPSSPQPQPARVGLSQAITLLQACMAELQQLRKAQYASHRLQAIG